MLQFIILTQQRNSETIPEYSEEYELKPVDGRGGCAMCNKMMILPNSKSMSMSTLFGILFFWKGKGERGESTTWNI